MIDQLPGKEIIKMLRLFQAKQTMLRQMIVAKYATNSMDIHYILANALDLQQFAELLLQFVKTFLQSKGTILAEFVDLESTQTSDI